MKHTPGPWRVGEPVESDGKLVYIPIYGNNRYISSISAFGKKEDGTPAGRQYHNKMATTRHTRVNAREMEANAHLIAAAPDLLEACKDALSAMELIYYQRIDTDDEPAVVNRIKQAIAKAINI